MSDEIEFDFTNEVDKATWQLLEPHHKRGAVFLVAEHLDLALVARAMSKDNVSAIKIWLDNGELSKLEDKDCEAWKEDITKFVANFIIVQPYVLIKPL